MHVSQVLWCNPPLPLSSPLALPNQLLSGLGCFAMTRHELLHRQATLSIAWQHLAPVHAFNGMLKEGGCALQPLHPSWRRLSTNVSAIFIISVGCFVKSPTVL